MYEVITFEEGQEVNRFQTTSEKEVKTEYTKSLEGNCAVRVFEDGIKMSYEKSNSLFGSVNRRFYYGNTKRK